MTRIGCTGHQNIKGRTRRTVASAVARELDAFEDDKLIGYTSLAEGADQLFALSLLAAGGELHVIIPSADYDSSFQSAPARDTYLALLDWRLRHGLCPSRRRTRTPTSQLDERSLTAPTSCWQSGTAKARPVRAGQGTSSRMPVAAVSTYG